MLEGETLAFDLALRTAVHSIASPGLTSALTLTSRLGGPAVLAPSAQCWSALFAWRRWWRGAALMAVSMVGAAVLDAALKLAFHRRGRRPTSTIRRPRATASRAGTPSSRSASCHRRGAARAPAQLARPRAARLGRGRRRDPRDRVLAHLPGRPLPERRMAGSRRASSGPASSCSATGWRTCGRGGRAASDPCAAQDGEQNTRGQENTNARRHRPTHHAPGLGHAGSCGRPGRGRAAGPAHPARALLRQSGHHQRADLARRRLACLSQALAWQAQPARPTGGRRRGAPADRRHSPAHHPVPVVRRRPPDHVPAGQGRQRELPSVRVAGPRGRPTRPAI